MATFADILNELDEAFNRENSQTDSSEPVASINLSEPVRFVIRTLNDPVRNDDPFVVNFPIGRCNLLDIDQAIANTLEDLPEHTDLTIVLSIGPNFGETILLTSRSSGNVVETRCHTRLDSVFTDFDDEEEFAAYTRTIEHALHEDGIYFFLDKEGNVANVGLDRVIAGDRVDIYIDPKIEEDAELFARLLLVEGPALARKHKFKVDKFHYHPPGYILAEMESQAEAEAS